MARKEVFEHLKKAILFVCALLAVLILIDYTYSSSQTTEKVISKNRRLENKHSVARNYYYAYYLNTESYQIPVTKKFRDKAQEGTILQLEISLLFNEINKVTISASGESEVYSFRMASGLFLPSLVLLILGIGWKLGDKIATLVFVSQVVLLANFFFLLFN